MSSPLKNKAFLSLFLTIMIDMLGIGIIIPVLAVVFLSPETTLFSHDVSFATRTLYLGILTTLYPLAQFFGAPIIGALADKFGRKKMLILSLIGTCIGYILFAIGVVYGNLWILFISRLIDGFTGGNISVAQAAISDMAPPTERLKYFGFIGMAFGFGFIIGPFIGGKLADPNVVSWFTNATPFIFSAILTLVNIISLQLFFKETLLKKRTEKITVYTGLKNIYKAFSFKETRVLFIVAFLFMFGFTFFTQFSQVFLIKKFDFTQSMIGNYFAVIGILIAVMQGFVGRIVGKKWQAQDILRFAPLVLALGFFLFSASQTVIFLYLVTVLIVFGNGITQPNLFVLISKTASPDAQGELFGINQSVQSLAVIFPPILAGLISSVWVGAPVFVAGMCTLIAWIIFVLYYRHEKEFHAI
ncbi:MFS transporter [Candidatus Nomurabacteria bacterium]|nr:MFS transporter [Candidatus Nomurabacteria bacterium]